MYIRIIFNTCLKAVRDDHEPIRTPQLACFCDSSIRIGNFLTRSLIRMSQKRTISIVSLEWVITSMVMILKIHNEIDSQISYKID
jgi:hypothetical protein